MTSIRNPQAEASAVLGSDRVGAVLEPSPPAVNEGPWFADHPPTAVPAGAVTVSPIHDGEHSWTAAIEANPSIASFARDHWLGDLGRLGDAPASLAATRRSLTALAFFVISPARQQANGKIGLRWTKGGFGTPFFGDDRQIRVEGTDLVVQDRDSVDSIPITTLEAAGRFVGVAPGAPTDIDFHDQPPSPGDDTELGVDGDAVAFLDGWFGFSTHVLERVRERAGSPDDTRVQLWPEHFDPAVELGDADAGTRASFGASPGDDAIPEPYLYVSPWSPRKGDFWNTPFGGGALTLTDLHAAPDQVAAAVEFFERGRSLLG